MRKIILSCLFFPLSLVAKEGNYYHIDLGGGAFHAGESAAYAPVISVGKRFDITDAAIDISASWSDQTQNNSHFKYYALPKITYLKFHEPQANSSLYYGGGLSWSQVKRDDAKFSGLFAEGTIGYDLQRHASIHPFLHLDIAQPLLADEKTGKNPGPSIIFAMSVGF